jgi:ABC-type glycerol-3-phosphate transport system substrate-binding protein
MMLSVLPALAEEGGLAPMTTENITLSVAHWGQAEAGEPEVIEALIAQFEAAYPNINVEFVAIDQGTWDQGLTNLASEGKLPDVFWVFNVPNAVSNGWAMDITEFFEKDPVPEWKDNEYTEFYKYLTKLRHDHPALDPASSFKLLKVSPESISYRRKAGRDKVTVTVDLVAPWSYTIDCK